MVLNHCILEDKEQKRKIQQSDSDQEYTLLYYYEFIEDFADTIQPESKYVILRMAKLQVPYRVIGVKESYCDAKLRAMLANLIFYNTGTVGFNFLALKSDIKFSSPSQPLFSES